MVQLWIRTPDEDGWRLWVQDPPVACCTFNHDESAEIKDLVFSSVPVFPTGTPGPSCWLLRLFALTLSLHVFQLGTNADNWDTAGMTTAPSSANAAIFSMASSSHPTTISISDWLEPCLKMWGAALRVSEELRLPSEVPCITNALNQDRVT